MKYTFSINMEDHLRKIRQIPIDRRTKLQLILESVGVEAVNQITKLTSQTKAGVRAGDGPRRAHPGGWADVTTNLVRAISHELKVSGGSISLYIGVLADRGLLGIAVDDVIEYAVHLDNMEGISVLAGVPQEAFMSLVKNLRKVYNG